MKKCCSYLLLFVFLGSCKVSPETKFNQDGISFVCPQGWKITDQEDFLDFASYLTVEKDGFSSSGMMSLTWLNSESDLDVYLAELKAELKSSLIYRKSNLTFGEQYQSVFNKLQTTAVDYRVSFLGVDHQGVIHLLNKAGKTICIMKQEALEDMNQNKEGFQKMEESFKVLLGT